jgi:ABC-type sugar transport system ATPase subunit
VSTATRQERLAAAPWLSCQGLVKRYGGITALAGVDMALIPGEVHGLIGPNGAGKSTLVKILAGAEQADAGTVWIDGEAVHLVDPSDAQRHRLVLMPQELAVVPDFNLVENVTLGAEPTRHGLRWGKECRRSAEEALALVGLALDLDLRAGELSGAHQRMLMMARAIDRDARLIILDEPTAGLPPHEAALVGEAVHGIVAARDTTVLYVSHHLTEVVGLCDRVSCVREGRLVATLEASDVTLENLVSAIISAPADGGTRTRRAAPARLVERTPDAGAPTVELHNVTGRRLRDVSIRAGTGEVTGLTGLLGSGVAEVVAMIVGATRPLAGEVRIGGERVFMASPADALDCGVGYLAGNRAQAAFPTLRIRENVSLAALRRWFGRLGLIRRAVERARVTELLAALSVDVSPERLLGTLSGGNQQRALVARLLGAEVGILVLDEPTVGVDIGAREELWDEVRALAAHYTVIVASSEPDELTAVCDRVVCIRAGSVSAVLERESITEHEITRAIA